MSERPVNGWHREPNGDWALFHAGQAVGRLVAMRRRLDGTTEVGSPAWNPYLTRSNGLVAFFNTEPTLLDAMATLRAACIAHYGPVLKDDHP